MIPERLGFTQVSNRFYLAGGFQGKEYFNAVKCVNSVGEVVELSPMASQKAYFPMVLWHQKHSLITVGGYDGNYLKEVTQFSIDLNKWSALPDLPNGLCTSTAVIMDNVHLYNFGGQKSK